MVQLKIFVNYVVFELKMSFHKLFQDFLRGDFVDYRKRVKPLDFAIDFLESSNPVGRKV